MTIARNTHEIANFIVQRDPAFAALVRVVGPPPARRNAKVEQRFAHLVRSITFQLLATKAATTIHARVEALCGREVTPTTILRVGHVRLREAGLSNAKAAAMIDLARRTHEGELRLDRHGRLHDDEILREVVAVRGVGPWTAQMYLMHTLARRDVWPVGDFGVRTGWSLVHGHLDTIDARSLNAEGDLFSGERSAVAWYCWRAVELDRYREQ